MINKRDAEVCLRICRARAVWITLKGLLTVAELKGIIGQSGRLQKCLLIGVIAAAHTAVQPTSQTGSILIILERLRSLTIRDRRMQEHAGFKRIANAPLGRMGVPFLIDLDIDGFLARADALKIYEMAYHSAGDVLELGTHKGLSTSIISEALAEADGGNLETVDIDAAANKVARENVDARGLGGRVTFTIQDAAERMDEFISLGRKFGFVFIDHWHGYHATYEAASRLRDLLKPGGYVLFHDFLDPGNSDPNHVYGVYQAVLDTICLDPEFEFVCNSGCCGLFRRKPQG